MKLIWSALSVWKRLGWRAGLPSTELLISSHLSSSVTLSVAQGSWAVGTWGSLTAMAPQYLISMQWIKEQAAGTDPNKTLRKINKLKAALCDLRSCFYGSVNNRCWTCHRSFPHLSTYIQKLSYHFFYLLNSVMSQVKPVP